MHSTTDSESLLAMLHRLHAEASERVTTTATALETLVHDREGANDDDEHDPDGVTLSSEWSRLSGLLDEARAEQQQIEAALDRWNAGTYGVCISCGTGIPAARLEIRPFAERCVPCAEKR
ncbi:TraR/DksA family transcriptional regulator [Microbacterium sp. YY-01]|uniref:TraR/DksA family transcriptional regulator n=1 Tax=Microbacterium sp. YY-01 TaxID=3421634 RepID=UPI003D18106E